MDIDHLVVGGGIAGTTVAVSLLQKKVDFLLIEGSGRLGGKIETKFTDEACFEFGPNSFTDQTDDIFHLLRTLDLEGEILEPAPAARNRYILKKGKIVRLPTKPQEFFTTKSLSLKGKLRLISEAFYVPQRGEEAESVHDFFFRHFGMEVADYFADPFVSGIFAGEASKLLLATSFPMMAEAEANSSSLLRYLLRKRKTGRAAPKTYQLQKGLESIFHQARAKIGEEKIHLSEPVRAVIPEGTTATVVTDRATYRTRRLYLTAPAYAAAACFAKSLPELARQLAAVEYAPVTTVHLRVSHDEAYPFDGFGILLPSVERRKILGVLWNSSTFPELFGDKRHHYLTVYVGGMRQSDLALADETTVGAIVLSEVGELFGLKKEAELISLRQHRQAIPQYTRSHGAILERVQTLLSAHPAVKLAGNYLAGVSIPRTVTHAMRIVV